MERIFAIFFAVLAVLLAVILWAVGKKWRLLRKEEEELETFLKQIPGGIFSYTADEKEELGIISEGLWKLFEYDDEEEFRQAVHNHFSEMVYKEDRKRVLESIDKQVENTPHDKVEYRIVTKTGKLRWVYDCGHLAEDSTKQKTFYVAILDDTEQKEMQENLEKARSVSRAKSDFLSNMSHEIRTPMNAIIGMTAIARQHRGEPEKMMEYLDNIALASEHLLLLINDILDMSKIESGKIELHEEAFDFKSWMERTKALFSLQAAEKHIQFLIHCEGYCKNLLIGDTLHLNQIIYNLLSNALKFTPENGSVTLSIALLRQEGRKKWIQFQVTDTGPGIASDNLSRIFEAFEQESAATAQQFGGTGLGLPISKKLAELMGGSIEARSEVGKGSVFVVTLPFTVAEKMQQGLPAAQFDFTGKRILTADDNVLNREIIKELMHGTGAEIDCVEDGKQALEAFLRSDAGYYDLILMDVQMPVMNGLDAAAAIRTAPREDAKSVLIFAITASAFSEDVEKSLRYGMNAHITKPINLEQLCQTWDRFLNGKDTTA